MGSGGLPIPPGPLAGPRAWRRLPEEGMGGEKRSADPMAPPDVAQAAEGENAPWKSQRRRFKRPRLEVMKERIVGRLEAAAATASVPPPPPGPAAVPFKAPFPPLAP